MDQTEGPEMNPLDIWDEMLQRAESVDQLNQLGKRMKNDLQQHKTFRGHESEMRRMWEERRDQLS